MNPLGHRYEEKKTSIDPEPSFAIDDGEDFVKNEEDFDYEDGVNYTPNSKSVASGHRSFDTKSQSSYKSTQSSRSSVLQRAREYSRRIEEQQQQQQQSANNNNNSNHSRVSPRRGSGASGYNPNNDSGVAPGVTRGGFYNTNNHTSSYSADSVYSRPRAKSLERNSQANGNNTVPVGSGGSDTHSYASSSLQSNRSKSAGRVTQSNSSLALNNPSNNKNNNFLPSSGSRPSTRERALASVRKEATPVILAPVTYSSSNNGTNNNSNRYLNNTNNINSGNQSYNSPLNRNSSHNDQSVSFEGYSNERKLNNSYHNDGRTGGGDIANRTPTIAPYRTGYQGAPSNPTAPISGYNTTSVAPVPIYNPARSPSPVLHQQQQHQQRHQISQVPVTQQHSNHQHQLNPNNRYNNSQRGLAPVPTPATMNRRAEMGRGGPADMGRGGPARGGNGTNSNVTGTRKVPDSPSRSQKSGNTMSVQSHSPLDQQRSHLQAHQQQPVVTPELLVDALSGHEDGLLAIAEKLMEHYDAGYDVMGEAIIDAFADVQKLFQHVVEAAHMEGAAFEASRREEEMVELRRLAALGGSSGAAAAAELVASGMVEEGDLLAGNGKNDLNTTPNNNNINTSNNTPSATSPNGPMRHDEFIDQDVKDILTEAIRKGTVLRSENKYAECYQLYEAACQEASSMLPVDSDHRGRLQLSLARAESMNPDRSCAILRYSMDDVLRSGMRAHRTPLPDPSKRADVVLNRPKGHPSITGANGQVMSSVIQSSDEALASLIEEMKEILSAPIYVDTPLQGVAKRFWAALADAQKVQQKNEERLEQSLGKLKVEFLLARAEWEEKLNKSTELAELYKEKYRKLKESSGATGESSYLEQARSLASKLTLDDDNSRNNNSNDNSRYGRAIGGAVGSMGRSGSVVSGVSGLAQHAKTLVSQMNNFNCTAMNERNNQAVYEDEDGTTFDESDVNDSQNDTKQYGSGTNNQRQQQQNQSRNQIPSRSSNHRTQQQEQTLQQQPTASSSSRSFQDYTKSPRRVDV